MMKEQVKVMWNLAAFMSLGIFYGGFFCLFQVKWIIVIANAKSLSLSLSLFNDGVAMDKNIRLVRWIYLLLSYLPTYSLRLLLFILQYYVFLFHFYSWDYGHNIMDIYALTFLKIIFLMNPNFLFSKLILFRGRFLIDNERKKD